MAYQSLRDFIEATDKERELLRVHEEVDWYLKVGAFVRRLSDISGPAVLFEKIKGHQPGYRLFCNAVGNYPRLAMSLGLNKETPPSQIIGAFADRVRRPVPPVQVPSGPCKEVVLKGKDVDLTIFPAPHWHEWDGGRYLGTWNAIIFRDPDSEWVNAGLYRNMVHDRDHIGILALPAKHPAEWPDTPEYRPKVCDWSNWPEGVRDRVLEKLSRAMGNR